MADFCKQCAIELGFPTDDLAGASTPEDTANGLYTLSLCESCGFVLVDHDGTCIDPTCDIHGTVDDAARS